MRKMPILLSVLFAVTLISMLTISPAQASIEEPTWLPPYVFKGYDDMYYQEYIVGYETGEEALLSVPVYSNYYMGSPYWDYQPINVSAVIVEFDWGINYTSTEVSEDDPVQIPKYETETFTIEFTVPSTTVASNLLAHEYTIWVEHVNATTGSKEIRDRWSADWDWWYPDYMFAVFSADQADIMDLFIEYQAYYDSFEPEDFDSAEASFLAGEAVIEATAAHFLLMRGDFAGAKTKLETAVDLYTQAFTAGGDWGTTYQGAMLNVTLNEADANKTLAKAAMTEADAVLNQSYAYLLFGIGFIIIGVGVLVYAYKKPQAAA
jgi:hypothetical protein